MTTFGRIAFLAASLSLLPSAFAHAASPHRHHRPVASPNQHPLLFRQVGVASWYGKGFKGQPTASGQPMDPDAKTAAHKLLPLGVHARVTNLENGRTVEVRINDRGPYIPGRIIDLSARAARDLHMKAKGVVPVLLEVFAADQPPELMR